MSTPSGPMRCLLDKNVVRLVVTGLYLRRRQPLYPSILNALTFWETIERRGFSLCITQASAHILRRRQQHAAVRFVLATTTELRPGRYCRRWARRLRETTGLTHEDAVVLALALLVRTRWGLSLALTLLSLMISRS